MSTPEIVTDTFEPTVAWLDEALGNDWSFRVVSYEIREEEALVLGELAHAGRVRQQFGRSCGSGRNDDPDVGQEKPGLGPVTDGSPWETLCELLPENARPRITAPAQSPKRWWKEASTDQSTVVSHLQPRKISRPRSGGGGESDQGTVHQGA